MILLLHLTAKEYGKTPSEYLRGYWHEFEFDAAVMLAGHDMLDPKKNHLHRPGQKPLPSAEQLARRGR